MRSQLPESATSPYMQTNPEDLSSGWRSIDASDTDGTSGDPTLMSEEETMKHLAEQKLAKIVSMNEGQLESISEHTEEDMFSQINSLQQSRYSRVNRRETMYLADAAAAKDLTKQINDMTKKENRVSHRLSRPVV